MLLTHTHIQIGVLTKNTIPLITPLLDQALLCQQFILLVSPNHTAQLPYFERFLRQRNINLTVIQLKSDLQCLDPVLLPYKNNRVAVNISEGRPGITGQLLLWAKRHKHCAFWLNANTDKLRYLLPEDHPPIALGDHINISDFLALNGMAFKEGYRHLPNQDQLLPLASKWQTKMHSHRRAFQTLNWLSSSASGLDLTSQSCARHLWNKPHLQQLIRDLKDLELVRKEGDRRVTFSDPTVASFVRGGWLEYACFATLHKLKATRNDIQDIALGVKIERHVQGTAVVNEIDVIALINNRLFLIECKTGKLAQKPLISQQVIYRLDSLSELLGESCHGFIVSLEALGNQVNTRALEVGMHLLEGSNIEQLTTRIEWIANGGYSHT
ncbi:Card1-like endonuclease domain-containing protein [Vibrio alfacsensis]|uniref:Card1-like endonuclease domain-containing protein n=1 Tax=Vibrio alfacsensis TaxID=1074311 RepID=UPI0040677604